MAGPAGQSCPICGRDVSTSADNKSRPFCSARCKIIDLDKWLSGSYRVPGPPVESSGMGEIESASNGSDTDHSYELKGDEDP
ncbi:MAG: DNA gyrase inhibitor YacG [Polyangiaceae bacterium]|nr:DNA gyrase inhibitor YacG [Polyangiaceae bacterium]